MELFQVLSAHHALTTTTVRLQRAYRKSAIQLSRDHEVLHVRYDSYCYGMVTYGDNSSPVTNRQQSQQTATVAHCDTLRTQNAKHERQYGAANLYFSVLLYILPKGHMLKELRSNFAASSNSSEKLRFMFSGRTIPSEFSKCLYKS